MDVMGMSTYSLQAGLTSACGVAVHLQHLGGHEVDLGIVRGLDASPDPKHLPNGVFVPMADLKVLPCLPECSCCLGV